MRKTFAILAIPFAIAAAPTFAQDENVTGKPPFAGQIDPNVPPGTDRTYEAPVTQDRVLPDQEVASQVRRSIENDQALSPSARNVMVSSQGGTLVLSGAVESTQEKIRLLSLAMATPNVQVIEDRIVVQNP